jgi:hypothetical protein
MRRDSACLVVGGREEGEGDRCRGLHSGSAAVVAGRAYLGQYDNEFLCFDLAAKGDHGGELFRVELPAVFVLEARAGARVGGGDVTSAGRTRRWGCMCTFRFAGSAVISAISRFTRTRIRRRSGVTWRRCWLEFRLYASQPFIGGTAAFVYFGGGTPSYLSVDQLKQLFGGLQRELAWDEVEEVTFECEPGTLTDHKLEGDPGAGVTRLSLGVENFDDHILEINGRAHHGKEIVRAYEYARSVGFPQINIDLIAGMIEETEANWQACVRRALELAPDSVTIYEMEIPYNTTIYQRMKAEGNWWRRWRIGRPSGAGCTRRSRNSNGRDTRWPAPIRRCGTPDPVCVSGPALEWGGPAVAGGGVVRAHRGDALPEPPRFRSVREGLETGRLPIYRALTPTAEERLIREFILQLKLGRVGSVISGRNSGWTPATVCRAAGAACEAGDSWSLRTTRW